VAATQHRRVRGRSGECHHLWPVSRGDQRLFPVDLAAGQGPLPACDWPEREWLSCGGSQSNFGELEQRGVQFATARNARSIRELRALSAETLLGTDPRAVWSFRFWPVDDGWVLPAPASQLLAEGRFHNVSLMVGATADEATSLIADLGVVSAAAFRASASERYGTRAPEFLALYPADTDEQAVQAQLASWSDYLVAGMLQWARLHNAHSDRRAFVYYFDRRLPGRNSAFYGAWHAGELYYVFGTLGSTDRP